MSTNQLFNGDCLEILKDISDKSVDLVLCDLPYGVTDCEWDSLIPLDKLWAEYNRVTKDNAPIVLFSIQPFTTTLIHSNIDNFRYCWYWHKNNKTGAPFAKIQPMRCVEDICVFYKHKPVYNPQNLIKLDKPQTNKPIKNNQIYKSFRCKEVKPQQYTNYPNNLLQFNNVFGKDRYHPTQKPVELLEYLIKTYTNENDLVLDNCMGSGSTGVAAMHTSRNFIGIELNEYYYDIAQQRINTANYKELAA